MSMPRLIGITGKAGAGKDTLATALVNLYGYGRYSFAGPLKAMLSDQFGWTTEQWEDRKWKESPVLAQLGKDMVPTVGYSPRQMAQWLGTDVIRRFCGPNFWVELFEREWNRLNALNAELRLVVPDVRFNNEARRIRALGGIIARVVRDDVQEVAAHSSEDGIDEEFVDITVYGKGGQIPQFIEAGISALRDWQPRTASVVTSPVSVVSSLSKAEEEDGL